GRRDRRRRRCRPPRPVRRLSLLPTRERIDVSRLQGVEPRPRWLRGVRASARAKRPPRAVPGAPPRDRRGGVVRGAPRVLSALGTARARRARRHGRRRRPRLDRLSLRPAPPARGSRGGRLRPDRRARRGRPTPGRGRPGVRLPGRGGAARAPSRDASRAPRRRGYDWAARGAQGVRDARRAMVVHGPGDLRAEELPVPRPETGELVLRIDAALTCGTDVKTLRRGHPVRIPKVPTVFGHEFAGTVTAVGAGVRGVREGDRVVAANSAPCGACRPCLAGRSTLCEDLLFVHGAYGAFIALPPRLVAQNVLPRAPTLPAVRAAFAEPLACALLGIDRARVESGQTVVVFGAGPLGCLLGMVAAARKARVIMVG